MICILKYICSNDFDIVCNGHKMEQSSKRKKNKALGAQNHNAILKVPKSIYKTTHHYQNDKHGLCF